MTKLVSPRVGSFRTLVLYSVHFSYFHLIIKRKHVEPKPWEKGRVDCKIMFEEKRYHPVVNLYKTWLCDSNDYMIVFSLPQISRFLFRLYLILLLVCLLWTRCHNKTQWVSLYNKQKPNNREKLILVDDSDDVSCECHICDKKNNKT